MVLGIFLYREDFHVVNRILKSPVIFKHVIVCNSCPSTFLLNLVSEVFLVKGHDPKTTSYELSHNITKLYLKKTKKLFENHTEGQSARLCTLRSKRTTIP